MAEHDDAPHARAEKHRITHPQGSLATFGGWVAERGEPGPVSYVQGGTEVLTRFRAMVGGHAISLTNIYEPWGGPSAPQHFLGARWVDPLLAYDDAIVPIITFMPAGVDLAGVAAGAHDDYIDTIATGAVAYGDKPLVFRWAHEMNTTWFPWSERPANYIAAWQRIVTRTRALAPNVRFFWCPYEDLPGGPTLADYWPGPEHVDIVGHDAYPFESPSQTWDATHLETYERVLALPGADSKIYWIGETAYPIGHERDPRYDRARYHAYVQQMFDSLTHYPSLRAVVWFDENKHEMNGVFTSYKLETAGAAAQTAMAAGLATLTNRDPLLGEASR